MSIRAASNAVQKPAGKEWAAVMEVVMEVEMAVAVTEPMVAAVMAEAMVAEVMAVVVMAAETVAAAMVAETAAHRSPRRRSTAQRAARSSHHTDSPPRTRHSQRRASLVWSMRAHRCTASHRLLTDPQTERSCTAGSSWSSD